MIKMMSRRVANISVTKEKEAIDRGRATGVARVLIPRI